MVSYGKKEMYIFIAQNNTNNALSLMILFILSVVHVNADR